MDDLATYGSVLSGDMLFEKSITPMVIVDSTRRIIKANLRFYDLFGHTAEEIVGESTAVLTPSVAHFEEYIKYFEKTRDGSYESSELQYRKKDGTLFWVKLTGIPIQTNAGRFILWSFDNIDNEVKAREEIRNRQRELEVIFDTVRAGLVYVIDDVIERANQSFVDMVNESRENVIGRKISIFLNCFDQCKNKKKRKIVQFHNRAGRTVLVEREIVQISPDCYLIIFLDVTEHVKEKKKLKQIAEKDGLTGIYNRGAFVQAVQKMVVDERYETVSFVMFDIDFFKNVNDTYGHDIGDDVLREVVEVVGNTLRREELFGRIGGEEFGIIFPVDLKQAKVICERIRKAVRERSFTIKNLHITISMGLVDNTFSNLFDSMYKEADRLLYVAKNSGRDRMECLPVKQI